MKKALMAIIVLFALSISQVGAISIKNYTDDYKIASALALLKTIDSQEIFANLDYQKAKIMFYDLSLISYSYATHYAVTSVDNFGDRYILINSRYKNAPPEAIACLIVHESYHKSNKAFLDEEILATNAEAIFWLKLKPDYIDNNDKLVARLNKLETLYKNSNGKNNLIKENIENNTFYQKQLAMK